jgi:hypothetical protein
MGGALREPGELAVVSRWRWALAVVAFVLFVGYALALVGSEFVGALW